MHIKIVPLVDNKLAHHLLELFSQTPERRFDFAAHLNLDKYKMEALPVTGETVTLELGPAFFATYKITAIGHSFKLEREIPVLEYEQMQTMYASLFEVSLGGIVFYKEGDTLY